MLYNQPTFSNVFQKFIKWIEHCLLEVQQQKEVSYHPVLVAHNGFAFDFLFLVAEVKRRKLDEIFSTADLYYADTLHDARRVSGTHLCNM